MMEKDKRLNATLFILAAALLTYTAIRAYLVSITYDEATSYIEFARNGYVLPVIYNRMSANDHILNTFFMIAVTKMFGVNEFVIRIPVLFAHAAFLFCSGKILKNISENGVVVILGFIIINVNPYLLDYFSLARGYGLSFGFMMASLYYLQKVCVHEHTQKSINFSVFFGALAVLSNFVMLNYFIVLMALIGWLILRDLKTNSASNGLIAFKTMLFPLTLTACLFLFVVPILLKLKEAGAIFYGGSGSFFDETITGSAIKYMYENDPGFWIQRVLKSGAIVVVLCSSIFVVLGAIKSRLTENRLYLSSLILLLVLCSLSTVIQHCFFNTPYLIERTSLFLVIIFSLIFVAFISELSKHRKAFIAAMTIAAVFCSVNFAGAFNLRYVRDWKCDADTKEMLNDLEKIKIIPEEKKIVSIGIPLEFDPAINFYRAKNNLLWLNAAWENEPTNKLNDYFYLSPEMYSQINKDSVDVIKVYPLTKNVFARPKYRPEKISVLVNTETASDKASASIITISEKDQFGPVLSYAIDDSSIRGKEAVVVFSADVKAIDSKDDLKMIISFQDEYGEVYSWQYANVKDVIRDMDNWFEARLCTIVPTRIKRGDEIRLYFSNKGNNKLMVRNQSLKWLEYHY